MNDEYVACEAITCSSYRVMLILKNKPNNFCRRKKRGRERWETGIVYPFLFYITSLPK